MRCRGPELLAWLLSERERGPGALRWREKKVPSSSTHAPRPGPPPQSRRPRQRRCARLSVSSTLGPRALLVTSAVAVPLHARTRTIRHRRTRPRGSSSLQQSARRRRSSRRFRGWARVTGTPPVADRRQKLLLPFLARECLTRRELLHALSFAQGAEWGRSGDLGRSAAAQAGTRPAQTRAAAAKAAAATAASVPCVQPRVPSELRDVDRPHEHRLAQDTHVRVLGALRRAARRLGSSEVRRQEAGKEQKVVTTTNTIPTPHQGIATFRSSLRRRHRRKRTAALALPAPLLLWPGGGGQARRRRSSSSSSILPAPSRRCCMLRAQNAHGCVTHGRRRRRSFF